MARIQGESAPSRRWLRAVTFWLRAHVARCIAAQPTAGLARATASRVGNQCLRVLVVDDNPSHLDTASALLGQCGIVAHVAADGAEAVALCREQDFHLVLMDLQMPVLDGLAATSSIRRHELLQGRPRTPIVAFSNWQSTLGLLDACGFSGLLSKPCGLAQLEACLVRWCAPYEPCAPSATGPGLNPPELESQDVWQRQVPVPD